MKINATIDYTEYDLELAQSLDDERNWYGYLVGDIQDKKYIQFILQEGVVVELSVDESISTEKGIILERLINAFREFNEAQQMGFEPEYVSEEDADEKKPYDPELIRVRPMFLSAFQVHRDITKGKIDLNPDFQRNFVWSDIQKSLLIESMLLKIPLPAFYFSEDKYGRYQVVDGLQRLTVINQFLNNEFKLRNLQYLNQLEGLYFSEDLEKKISSKKALYEPYDSRVESTQLNINVIEASSPLRVKYDIFYRINTGGRPLNRQEIRNCFATEKTRRLLKNMAINDSFNRATGYSVKDTRMDSQELALRYCGFYKYRLYYAGDMNSYLDNVLERLNDLSNDDLEAIQLKYFNSLDLAYHLFGQYSFRKCLPQHLEVGSRRQFLNKAMFIVWTVILSDIEVERVMNKPQFEFVSVLAQELDYNDELFVALTTGTTDRYNLEFVFEQFNSLLDNYLNA